mgnify:CR=1 FL=1
MLLHYSFNLNLNLSNAVPSAYYIFGYSLIFLAEQIIVVSEDHDDDLSKKLSPINMPR